MATKKPSERRESYEERSGVDRRQGGDRRKRQVPVDHPDRRGSGERRKGERRREEDRRGTSGSGGGGRDSGFKRARRTYHDSQRGRSEAEPRRTYRDGKE